MKILIVKTSSLGDIIHTFPVVDYLHQKLPDITIDWVVEKPFAELVEAHPYVSNTYHVNTKQWRRGRYLREGMQVFKALRKTPYDLLFDFQGNMKSALFTLLARASTKVGFGKETVSERLNLFTTHFKADPDKSVNVRQENLFLVQSYFQDKVPFEEKGVTLHISSDEKRQVETILKGDSTQKKVMVCPGSTWSNKQLSPHHLVDFLKKIEGDYHPMFLLVWGTQDEKKMVEEIHRELPTCSKIIDRLSIPVLQNLMDQMDLVIAMDSLPLHLAGTTRCPTFSFFGASSANKYKPDGSKHQAFQGICPYGRTFERRCPILRTCPTGSCIKQINVDELYENHFNGFSA